ncbi:mrg-domain-containing protein [Phaffia rhodozyma]|uniref:Chromatin modification-related protein EAF3 n=1 Tax=Phaffia rhodozyma TaxID=264483 RepID=A0A0F7SM26_PHARH|nr:mrg-domain-containing protein [Phaffia rhodozyma]
MSTTFSQGEQVLCFHGPLLYEAKILKVTEKTKPSAKQADDHGPLYLVHYKGWKQSWDENVPSSRLIKFDQAGLAKQKELIDKAKATAAPPPPVVTAAPTGRASLGGSTTGPQKGGRKSEGAAGVGRKRARDGDVEGEPAKRLDIKIPIPEPLKVQLVDDWENVTKNNQIVPLPKTPNVAELIQEYRNYALAALEAATASRKVDIPRSIAILTEVLSGLQLYFDKSLGANLLYRFERQQYLSQRRDHYAISKGQVTTGEEFEPSKIYGAEHLLRLFVNLPSYLAGSNMDAESVNILRDQIQDFMKWMIREQRRIFAAEYESTTTSYINLTRT